MKKHARARPSGKNRVRRGALPGTRRNASRRAAPRRNPNWLTDAWDTWRMYAAGKADGEFVANRNVKAGTSLPTSTQVHAQFGVRMVAQFRTLPSQIVQERAYSRYLRGYYAGVEKIQRDARRFGGDLRQTFQPQVQVIAPTFAQQLMGARPAYAYANPSPRPLKGCPCRGRCTCHQGLPCNCHGRCLCKGSARKARRSR
jgi:hypothetical protein